MCQLLLTITVHTPISGFTASHLHQCVTQMPHIWNENPLCVCQAQGQALEVYQGMSQALLREYTM